MAYLSTSLHSNLLSTVNPLRSLTMTRVVAEMENGQRGDYSHLQWLYHFIERRDSTLRGAKRRILSSLVNLEWDVKINADLSKGDAAKAETQAQALKAAYHDMKGFRAALKHLALAEFRGFAHVEKHYAPGGSVVELMPVPQWHWCRQGYYGDWLFQADALVGGISGVPIKPQNFLIREVEDPIDDIALIAFVRKGLSSKDFDAWIARYGIPFVFWVLSESMAAALASDPAKLTEWMALMRNIGSDGEGIFPGGEVRTLDAGGSAKTKNPFLEHIDYQDSQIVMAATSGKLTMLNEPTGLGSGNADAHVDTFDDIALALAMEVSELLHEQLDIPVLAKLFPGQEPLCYFELAAKNQEDVNSFCKNVLSLAQAGWEIDQAQLSEKTGFQLAPKPVIEAPVNIVKPPVPNEPPTASSKNRETAPAMEIQTPAKITDLLISEFVKAVTAEPETEPLKNNPKS